MIDNRNVHIITDTDSKKLVLINDSRFKGKRQIDWDDVKQYLKGYIGDYYEIEENAERIFIGNELPESGRKYLYERHSGNEKETSMPQQNVR